LLSGWGQFWVKERIFNASIATSDPTLSALKSKAGITFIAVTGVASGISVWVLVLELQSPELLTRMACFRIAALTVLTLLNVVLIHSLYMLRRLARLKEQIESASATAKQAIGLYWMG
jgi:hypothetical protein